MSVCYGIIVIKKYNFVENYGKIDKIKNS